jgi:hypothetical protein
MAAARGRPGTGGGPAFVVIAASAARLGGAIGLIGLIGRIRRSGLSGLSGLARGARRAAAAAAGPAPVSRREGQQLARAELSKAMYHPGLPIIERIEQAISRFLNSAGVSVPVGWWSIVALAALAVIIVAAVLAWIGPVARSRSRTADPLLSSTQLSARGHREQAERLAAAGDYSAAIIESVRAIAMELEERGVLPPRVGRTADEFAAEAGQALPGHSAGLREAAQLFDDVRYGERAGTASGYQRLRDLDARLRSARPASQGVLAGVGAGYAGAAGPGSAGPGSGSAGPSSGPAGPGSEPAGPP